MQIKERKNNRVIGKKGLWCQQCYKRNIRVKMVKKNRESNKNERFEEKRKGSGGWGEE